MKSSFKHLLIIIAVGYLILTDVERTNAQEPVVWRIEVKHDGTDQVGSRLVYFIKEGLRKSSIFLLSDDTETRLQLRLLTFDPSQNNDGFSTTYSAVWTVMPSKELFPFFLDHVVGTCGTKRVEEVAEELVASTDKLADELYKLAKAYKEGSAKE